jgi:predicted acylesterase/phospholipase RssA
MRQKIEKKRTWTKNKKGETFVIPTKQRALILQGGEALGYYEIGVLQSIYDNLFKNRSVQIVGDNIQEIIHGK